MLFVAVFLVLSGHGTTTANRLCRYSKYWELTCWHSLREARSTFPKEVFKKEKGIIFHFKPLGDAGVASYAITCVDTKERELRLR